MTQRRRMTVTVDPEVLETARAAVEAGRAPSLSAWVNDALSRLVDHDHRRFAAMDEAIKAFEAEHGEITDADIAEATRRTRARSIVVGGRGVEPRRR